MTPARVRPHVPDALRANAVQVWGEVGRTWLEDLTGHVHACAERWELAVGEPFALSFHWVAPARTAAGRDVVLKLGVPHLPHLTREADVLRRWGGRGAVRLVGSDPVHGALLLERALPGTTAADLVPRRDDEATRALMQVARGLHAATPDGLDLPDISSQAASMREHVARYGTGDPLPAGIVDQARELLVALTASRSSVVLLHGDLHHDNVLRHDGGGHEQTGGWVAIDPHGWRGDPGLEVGPMLYNPPGTPPDELVRLLPQRLELAAEVLGQPPDRLRAWGFVTAVLSQVWTCQDGGTVPDPGPAAVADALRPR